MKSQDYSVTVSDQFWGPSVDQLKGLTLRYNSKLDSIDCSKDTMILEQSGTVKSTSSDTETTSYTLKSVKNPDHTYKGTATAAKDVDCILVYNEKLGGYELHPLENEIRITSSPLSRKDDDQKDSGDKSQKLGSVATRSSLSGHSTNPSLNKPVKKAAASASKRKTAVMRNSRKLNVLTAKSDISSPASTPQFVDNATPPYQNPSPSPSKQQTASYDHTKSSSTTIGESSTNDVDGYDDLDDLANELEDALEQEDMQQRAEKTDRQHAIGTSAGSSSHSYYDGASSSSEEE